MKVSPPGWVLSNGALSPDGRFIVVNLADGRVGWWELNGSNTGQHQVAGYDLVWHPYENIFAYIGNGNQIHIVRLEPKVTHTVLESPEKQNLRYPFWGVRNGPGELYERDPDMILAIADPMEKPYGMAYLPGSSEWIRFDINMTPQTWEQIAYPSWLVQPWNPKSGYPMIFWTETESLGHPDAGTPYLLYQLPVGAEPLSMTWSPGGLAFVMVEKQPTGLVAHILHSFRDYDGGQLSLHPDRELVAVSDDGITTFTVSESIVQAKNHLTGTEVEWHVEGAIVNIHLGRTALLILQEEQVVIVPYH